MYSSLTAFQFYIFSHNFLRSTLFKLGIPSLCNIPSPALSHHVTPIPMLSLLTSAQCLQYSPWTDSVVQNITTHFAYDHVNSSITVSSNSYTNTEIIRPMQILTDQYPENHLVKSSHSGVAPHSILVIFVLSKQFSSFRCLFCTIQSSAYSTHTRLSNKILGHQVPYNTLCIQPMVWN